MNSKLLNSDTIKNQLLEQYISESLLDLGLMSKYKGFNYTIEATLKFPYIMQHSKPFKYLYTMIAEKYNINAKSVEHAIKISIESAWCSENINMSHSLFRFPYITIDKIPTNAAFIAAMSEIMRCNLKKCFFN